MVWIIKLSIIFLSVFYIQTSSHATDYNVCTACDIDTLAEVELLDIVAGDRILFNRGDSWVVSTNGTLDISWDGSADNSIYIGNYGTGSRPIVDFINITGSHIIVDGIASFPSINRSTNDVIHIDSAHDILLQDIYIDMNNRLSQVGIQGVGYSYDVEIKNSTVLNGGQDTGTQNGGGINISDGSHDFIIHNNVLGHNYEMGVQAFDGTNGSVPIENILVYDNSIYSSKSTTGGRNGLVCGYNNRNFVAYRNFVSGYYASLETDSGNIYEDGGTCTFINNVATNCFNLVLVANNTNNSTYYNNTLIGTSSPNTTGDAVYYQKSTTNGTGHKFINNIVSMPTGAVWYNMNIGSGNIVTTDKNLFYHGGSPLKFGITTGSEFADPAITFSEWNALGYDINSINADPLLKSDYSLYAGSPAINSGTNLSAYFTDDYAGNPRLGAWDIGAYEYTEGTREYINVGFSGVEVR